MLLLAKLAERREHWSSHSAVDFFKSLQSLLSRILLRTCRTSGAGLSSILLFVVDSFSGLFWLMIDSSSGRSLFIIEDIKFEFDCSED